MFVYITKSNELVTTSVSKIPYDETTVDEFEIVGVDFLPEKPGYAIDETWDSASNTLVQSYRPLEGYTEPVIAHEQPSIEEQILAENQYQTALLEMQMLGGTV